MMIPRMLLHRPPGGGVVTKEKLVGRFELFRQGHWTQLIHARVGSVIRKRRSPDTDDEDELQMMWCNGRACAEAFVQVGELSSARQALEGGRGAWQSEILSLLSVIRQGDLPDPRAPLPQDVVDYVPESPLELDHVLFKKNLRSSRRGAAAGPSGSTTEHVKVLLDEPRALHSFFLMAEQLSQGQVPTDVVDFIRLVLQKWLRK